MIGISFQRWHSKHTSMWNWYRVYKNNKWTCIIWAEPRYNGDYSVREKICIK